MKAEETLKEERTQELIKNLLEVNLNENEQEQITTFLKKMQDRISLVQDMVVKEGKILEAEQGSDALLGARWIKVFFGREHPNDTILITFVAKRKLGPTPQEDKTFYQLREITFTSREPPQWSPK